ncbi:aerolysin family beta-barrel pore-forming toxin [Clostridium tarantellae]|uniref:Aerolysin family beta-barrel pore-forming toxin n=1 Tax=Clostridium tarantellae TaxID=39493 RepID=A0A6I1MMB7_9CLOT|nr:aerolysin family beta-barrel pore-forming toxin [Clostridium tarantellae]MPQ43598.1 aerolysin family beta-barrel pore-forming toxin [Clostridium tarantellae]
MSSNIDLIKLKYENFNDLEEIKLKLCSHPMFIKKWALLGSFLGYEYCRGSNTRVIGEGYNVSKSKGDYYIDAINTSEYYFNRGWYPRIRLNMKVSNFSFKFIPDTIVPLISKKETLSPKVLSENYMVNNSNNKKNIRKEFKNIVSVSLKNNIAKDIFNKISLTNSYRFIHNDLFNDRSFKYNFSHKYTLGNQIDEIRKYNKVNNITINMPPRSKVSVKSILYGNKVILPYKALVLISYNIQLSGKINNKKNAYLGYVTPANLATKFTFGNDKVSAIEEITNEYGEKINTTDFYWDWRKLSENVDFNSFMKIFNKFECVEIEGKFSKINYNNVIIESGQVQPLNG